VALDAMPRIFMTIAPGSRRRHVLAFCVTSFSA